MHDFKLICAQICLFWGYFKVILLDLGHLSSYFSNSFFGLGNFFWAVEILFLGIYFLLEKKRKSFLEGISIAKAYGLGLIGPTGL